MKPLVSAKSRLVPDVDDNRRRAVVLLMLRRVLEAVGQAVAPQTCRVIGGDELVRRVAQESGCRWGPEPGHDLNSSLWQAMVRCYEEGAMATLFLPGDLPQVSPKDVDSVVSASAGLTRPVGVAAQSHGGTNALLLPAWCAFPPELGEASFERHGSLATDRGAPLETPHVPGLAFDVDTVAELDWALANLPGFAAELAQWEQWLLGQGEPVEP